MRLLLSILLGLLPEVFYYTLFISYTKNIKDKKILLFILISISYCLCIFIQRWQLAYYMTLIVSIYIIIKLLYKRKVQIIDIFIISLMFLWATILSALMLIFLKTDNSNYWMLYILDRIFLFIPFIFKNKFNLVYKKYCKLWNRNDKEKRPIKSITLRNISLIILNIFIFCLNIAIINLIEFFK